MRRKISFLLFFILSTVSFSHAAVIKYGTTEINAVDLNGVSTSFTDFYGFNGTSATTGLEVVNSVVMFFAELNGEYALFTIANKYQSGGTIGKLDVDISADSGAIEFVDDPSENSGTSTFSFNWGGNLTDGFIYGGFDDTFSISLDLFSKKGVDGAYVIDFTDGQLSSANYTNLIDLSDGPFTFSTASSGSLTSVPEPQFLMLIGVICLLFSRKRSRV